MCVSLSALPGDRSSSGTELRVQKTVSPLSSRPRVTVYGSTRHSPWEFHVLSTLTSALDAYSPFGTPRFYASFFMSRKPSLHRKYLSRFKAIVIKISLNIQFRELKYPRRANKNIFPMNFLQIPATFIFYGTFFTFASRISRRRNCATIENVK